MKTRYKFLKKGYTSEKGNMKWKIGKWYITKGNLDICSNGFHCSRGIYQAFSYIQGEILAKVEVEGKSIIEKDKECWEKMRIIKSWRWIKKDSVLFSIYAARLVLNNYEKEYPNDNRPRKAIEAAEMYINNPSKKNRKVIQSAAESAAWSAAWSAPESAARSAESAVWSAWSTAWSAVRSTESAARSAESAAWSAAMATESAVRSKIYKKLDKWMLLHLKELKKLKEI